MNTIKKIDLTRFFVLGGTNSNLIFWLIGLLLVMSAIFENRSLLIGYLFATTVILAIKNNIERKTILFLLGLMVTVVLILATSFKLDSTRGRLFIYKISLQILKNNFPSGVGKGNFDVTYGEYQINYFEKGNYNNQEFLLADNIIHCYNDILEITIEHGLNGIILTATILSIILLLVKRSLMLNQHNPILLLFAISQILGLGIASLFTFIIYQFHWQVVILASLLIVIYYNFFVPNKWLLFVNSTVIILLLVIHTLPHVRLMRIQPKFEAARNLYKAGYYSEANIIFNEVYPEMEKKSGLIRTYCNSLIKDNKHEQAKKILYKLINRENSHFNYDLLAYCFKQQNNIEKAEKYYLKAIHKAPNRFVSRYNLFILYLDSGQITKAKKLGNFLLKMPIKIPSPTIDHIKSIITTELKTINQIYF